MSTIMGKIALLCREKGLRMTEQRRIIVRVLEGADDHPDVEELHRRAQTHDPAISLATVYRTVRLLEEAGILDKHEFGGGRARYEQGVRRQRAPRPSGGRSQRARHRIFQSSHRGFAT